MFKPAIYTFLDQLIISGLNFFISFSLIYYSSSEEFGLYTLLMSFFYFFSSIQNAQINTPLMVLLPNIQKNKREIFKLGQSGQVLYFSIIIIIIALLILFISFSDIISRSYDFGLFFLILPLLLFRDYFRAIEYSKLNPKKAFKMDFYYVTLCSILILISCFFNQISISNIFIILGFSLFVVFFVPIFNIYNQEYKINQLRYSFNKSWNYSKWSVLGAASSWFQTNIFTYFPFLFIGLSEIAYLASARLLLTPIILLVNSWGNYYRPYISREFKSKYTGKNKIILFKSISILMFIILINTVFILLIFNLIPLHWIPNEYQHIDKFILIWSFIILISTIRKNISFQLQCQLEFKKIALIGLFTSIVTILVTFLLNGIIGYHAILISIFLGELLLMSIFIITLKNISYNG